MNELICLHKDYSTTKRVVKENPEIVNNSEDKFETVLFLPIGENRKGEGGLRTKGYFKKSYEEKPLISIITVVFNGEKYLEETILSVINQTYDNVEYIIIDGGSTDGTLDIIKKYEDKIDYWISEKDKGIYDAWNKALVSSNGKWIAFLGADDFYLETAIDDYLIVINKYKQSLDYISSSVEIINEDKCSIKIYGSSWEWKIFKKYMNVAHVGSIHNKQYFKKFGLFDSSYKIAADYEMLLRKKENLNVFYINKVTAKMRNGGVSNIFVYQAFKETLISKIKTGELNIHKSYFEYVLSYLKYIIKKSLFKW